MDTSQFETLLRGCQGAVERFVYYKLPSKADGDDVLQEVYLAAFQKRDMLQSEDAFKPWLLQIARNKCRDYYRARAKQLSQPFYETLENALATGRMGLMEENPVLDVLETLPAKEKQVLFMHYFQGRPQVEIAARLHVPLGTVKSRLYTARQGFKAKYPYPPKTRGGFAMKKMPKAMPEYRITPSKEAPFAVVWEELMGWFLVPRLGEGMSWGMYEMPTRACMSVFDMQVIGKAEVHGIEGVELTAREIDASGQGGDVTRSFVAQLTDTHCRYLATRWPDNGVQKYITFLDGDTFARNWGFGESNCGNETHIAAKADITRTGQSVTSVAKPFLLDIVGRYTVEIGGKAYDTVCVMDLETYNPGVVSEQYLDKNGRTILWRRFNCDDWALGRYKTPWSERLPDNERLTVNGGLYVHWYDCITDYIQ